MSLSISYMLAKGEKRFSLLPSPLTHKAKAKAAPNLQNRKWLNFQDKIERKSKVSKLNDVETVETVEGAEATRMTTRQAKMTEDIPKRDRNRDSGAIHLIWFSGVV